VKRFDFGMTLMSFLVAIMTIAHAAPTPFARPVPPENPIRVRIAHSSTFVITGTDITMNNQAHPGYRAFKIQNGQAEGQPVNTITGSNLRIDLKPVPQHLSLTHGNVIATLDLETYLQGGPLKRSRRRPSPQERLRSSARRRLTRKAPRTPAATRAKKTSTSTPT
jgi:hypothetical protein